MNTRAIVGSILIMCVVCFYAATSFAIPLYGMSSANECDTCHVEPLGWANPDLSERRCTLDCSGCHVSNAGGGLRYADGQFFGKEILPIWGTRPSSFAPDNDERRPKGFPKEGRWDWTDGWRGWWAGEIPHTEIDDRYGNIDPNPKWNFGGDFRFAILNQSTDDGAGGTASELFVFPMQADLYLLNESVKDLQMYVSVGLQGRKDTDGFSADDLEATDYFAIKELFLKYRYKYNSWIRAGRIVPRFGWRTPDHTAFARQDLGFNQNFHAFGAEVGINPNYFYADASIYFSGLDGWPGELGVRGTGSTFNIGYRDFGWMAGFSGHYFDQNTGSDDADGDGGVRFITAGVNGSLNFNPFIWYGEVNLRRTSISGDDTFDPIMSLVASHEFNYLITRGLYSKLKYDWFDRGINLKDDHKHRVTLGLDIHPYTFVHLEMLYRLGFGPVSPISEIADADVSEFLFMTHVWF